MLALRFNHFGAPSELQLQQLPTPVLKPDEVLVKIYAAAINPSDVKNVAGNMEHTTLPRTPGRDFAGVVVEGPKNLVGTEVWGTGGDVGFTRDGSHAEYIVLPKEAVRQKPRALSMEEAGSSGVTFDASACGAILETLTPGFESHDLHLLAETIETYSLEDAVKAYEQILNRNASGRVVLTPHEASALKL